MWKHIYIFLKSIFKKKKKKKKKKGVKGEKKKEKRKKRKENIVRMGTVVDCLHLLIIFCRNLHKKF